jgi:phosphopantothenate-cysteine ligase
MSETSSLINGGMDEEETFDNFDSSPSIPRSKRLIIDLDPVPKFLKNLVDGWAPEGMIVSFKLETDPLILVHKAQYSLERYQHHLVIGNLLSTRKWEVVFVSKENGETREEWIRVPRHKRAKSIGGRADMVGLAEKKNEDGEGGEVTTGQDRPSNPDTLVGEPEVEIESLIIPAVQTMHSRHIKAALARASLEKKEGE